MFTTSFFFNVLALKNILVALTREIGDGPCFLYIKCVRRTLIEGLWRQKGEGKSEICSSDLQNETSVKISGLCK